MLKIRTSPEGRFRIGYHSGGMGKLGILGGRKLSLRWDYVWCIDNGFIRIPEIISTSAFH